MNNGDGNWVEFFAKGRFSAYINRPWYVILTNPMLGSGTTIRESLAILMGSPATVPPLSLPHLLPQHPPPREHQFTRRIVFVELVYSSFEFIHALSLVEKAVILRRYSLVL